jgi:ubiquinone/menaquinone biosynthesis C-methylase UbiE
MPRGGNRPRRPRAPSHERLNRADWDRTAAEYERLHGRGLAAAEGMTWGNWHRPERELHVLGPVRGKDVLELGCGAARWSIALAQRGARMVGLDFSAARLEQARRNMAAAGVDFPLVEASAERVPLPARRFDIVFCDWGAVTFSDPYRTIPEVARLLRTGGRFAFTNASPFRTVCQGRTEDRLAPRLRYPYFGMHRIKFLRSIEFNLPYGEWIRLFRANGFAIEDLWEGPPPVGRRSTYLSPGETVWTRRWPYEVLWRLRKERAVRRSR